MGVGVDCVGCQPTIISSVALDSTPRCLTECSPPPPFFFPAQVACYSEIFRVLKPGAKFAMYEWVVTDKYDPNNREHVTIKKNIEVRRARSHWIAFGCFFFCCCCFC